MASISAHSEAADQSEEAEKLVHIGGCERGDELIDCVHTTQRVRHMKLNTRFTYNHIHAYITTQSI